ncbi:hypothetical protein HSBAA_36060 [Vreelandella sulfidaeris]|uniref:Orc1-like AAA ATPase domain-containing protein n=1 Tax=Vreelandella sulfidaeris TaxID=115553 RepID=A0A455U818_9GAMM|nr:hypothetical protein HSBAA_36060 [Halomonas sulfidaeris]
MLAAHYTAVSARPYGVARTLVSWYLTQTLTVDAIHELQASLGFDQLEPDRQHLLEEALGVHEVQEITQLAQSGEAVELVVMLLHRLIERQAATHTLVLMIDDLQWLDEPSFKVLAGLQARLPINTAFMLVASHHGRDQLPVKLHWDQQISLGNLDALQSSRLLSQLSRRYRIHLSPRLRNQIIERCDGVPCTCRRFVDAWIWIVVKGAVSSSMNCLKGY